METGDKLVLYIVMGIIAIVFFYIIPKFILPDNEDNYHPIKSFLDTYLLLIPGVVSIISFGAGFFVVPFCMLVTALYPFLTFGDWVYTEFPVLFVGIYGYVSMVWYLIRRKLFPTKKQAEYQNMSKRNQRISNILDQ